MTKQYESSSSYAQLNADITAVKKDEIIAGLIAENTDLRTRGTLLEEVVRFYADVHTWKSASVFMCGHDGNSRATIDRGEKARGALRSLGKPSAK